MKRKITIMLAGQKWGRIILHVLVAVQTHHFAYEFQGIVREFQCHQ